MQFWRLGIVFAKFVPVGLSLPILTGPLRGAKWIAGSAPGEAKGLSVIVNLSEPERLRMAKKMAPVNGICFDIGANVGLYTLLFARYSKHVFAFEPLPRNIRYLSRTLEVNRIGNATIVPCAVSDETGLNSLDEGPNPAEGKLAEKGRQPVATVSCDDFVRTYDVVPSLLKIDVEGAEMSVLKGAENLLSKHKPCILLSTHGEELRISCLRLLQDMKYGQILQLDPQEVDGESNYAVFP